MSFFRIKILIIFIFYLYFKFIITIYYDGVEWSTPWLCHLRQLLLHVVAANACQRLPTLPTLRILRATLRSVNVETCKHRCRRATPRNAE